jgi:hypothetical protein
MYGMDYLGGAKYMDTILKSHPKGWAAGFFVEESLFGSPKKVIEALAQSGKCPLIRLNLAWEDDHNFGNDDFAKAENTLKEYLPLMNKYPSVMWLVSGATEHKLKKDQANALAQRIIKHLPDGVNYVNNPWHKGGGEFIQGPRILNEIHGTQENAPRRGEYTYSYDGSSCVDDDVEARKAKFKSAKVFFFWHPAFNGRLTTQDTTPRPDRKAWPTQELIKSIQFLATNAGEKITIPKDFIWKSHADRHVTPPEPRAYKPVLITPTMNAFFELRTLDNKLVIKSENRLPFENNKSRYYFSEYGYVIAEKAKKLQGHSVCKLVADGKEVGRLNPAFRAGSFRP